MKRVIKATTVLASGWLRKATKSGYTLQEIEDIYNNESGKVIHIYENPTRDEVEDFKSWCEENIFSTKKVTAAKSFRKGIIVGDTWNEFLDKLERATGWTVADEYTRTPKEVDDFYIAAYDYSSGDEVELDIKVSPLLKNGEVVEYMTILATDVKVVR